MLQIPKIYLGEPRNGQTHPCTRPHLLLSVRFCRGHTSYRRPCALLPPASQVCHRVLRSTYPYLILWSDRGPTLVSSFITNLYRKLGIQGNPSTAYHPQTDGQTERMNQEIQTYLRIFVNHRQDDWVHWLPLAAFAYRNRVHSATGFSPFFMTHGHHPFTGVETKQDLINESAIQFAERMKKIGE